MGGGGVVYAVDLNPHLSSACQVSDGYIQVPRVTDERYLDVLKEYCLKQNISIIVPTIDTELDILALKREEFLKENIFIAVSSKEICDIFIKKDLTFDFFNKNGFLTPKILTDIKNCTYPIFAKLNNSSCSIGASIVSSYEEALYLSKNSNYIFQEHIDADEYTVDVFIDKNNKVICIVPRLRMEVRAGEVSKAKTIKDKDIILEVKKLCGFLKGAYGAITIQLFKRGKDIIFIEINPRFGGGYPLSYNAGADFAKYLIDDYSGIDLAYDESWRDNAKMLRYDAEVIV